MTLLPRSPAAASLLVAGGVLLFVVDVAPTRLSAGLTEAPRSGLPVASHPREAGADAAPDAERGPGAERVPPAGPPADTGEHAPEEDPPAESGEQPGEPTPTRELDTLRIAPDVSVGGMDAGARSAIVAATVPLDSLRAGAGEGELPPLRLELHVAGTEVDPTRPVPVGADGAARWSVRVPTPGTYEGVVRASPGDSIPVLGASEFTMTIAADKGLVGWLMDLIAGAGTVLGAVGGGLQVWESLVA